MDVLEKKALRCEKHGDFISERFNFVGIDIYTNCPKCEEERDIEEKRISDLEKSKKENDTMEEMGISKRFENCSFSNYTRKTEGEDNAFNKAVSYSDRLSVCGFSDNLFICGSVGTGKTHLSISILIAFFYHTDKKGFYTTALRMIRDIRSAYGKKEGPGEQDIINKYVRYPLLVLDEVGVQYGTEGEKILLFEVINGRYENLLPTILATNLSYSEMTQYLGERAIDRLRGKGGDLIVMDWKSYRRNI